MPEDLLERAVRESRRVQQRGRNRRWLYTAGSIVIGIGGSLIFLPAARGMPSSRAITSSHFFWFPVGIFVLLVVIGNVLLSRRGLDDAPYWGVSLQQRRQVARSIRRREVLADPALAAIALTRIRTLHRTRWLPVVILICAVVSLSAAVFLSAQTHLPVSYITVLVFVYFLSTAGWIEFLVLRAKQTGRAYRDQDRVRTDGVLVEPVSAWSVLAGSPLGKVGLILLVVVLLVLTFGIAVAADRVVTRRGCHRLPAADLAAITEGGGLHVLLGDAGPATGPDQPAPPLVAAREIDAPHRGLRYVAAYVRDPSGRLLGPAVWRLIEPRTDLNREKGIAVVPIDVLARKVTPYSEYVLVDHPEPEVNQARACAEAAR